MSTLAAVVYFVAFAGIVFIVPLAAQLALDASPLRAGLLLVPLTVMNVVLAPIAGAASDRFPVRFISTAGAFLVATGALLLARLPLLPTPAEIVGAVIVTGIGTAVFSQPNNSAIMGAAPPNRRGIAAGTLATARTTGQLLGVAIAGAIYFGRSTTLGALAHTFAPATLCFGTFAALMLCVSAISFLRE
jgi:MFS family permease